MATKMCPFCAKKLQVEDIVCKHCGRDLPRVEPAMVEKKGRRLLRTLAKWFGVYLVIGGVQHRHFALLPADQPQTIPSVHVEFRVELSQRLWKGKLFELLALRIKHPDALATCIMGPDPTPGV